MGKVKKHKNHQKTPYARQDSASVKAASVQMEEDDQMEDFDDQADDIENEDDEQETKALTRAGLLRRHKLEMRNLKRTAVADIKQQRSKLSKRVDKQLAGRKALTRDMKTMVAEMELRHKMELEMFDARQAELVAEAAAEAKPFSVQPVDMAAIPEIKFDLNFSAFTYKDQSASQGVSTSSSSGAAMTEA